MRISVFFSILDINTLYNFHWQTEIRYKVLNCISTKSCVKKPVKLYATATLHFKSNANHNQPHSNNITLKYNNMYICIVY